MKKLLKRVIRISLGVVLGFVILVGAVWVLSKTLGDHEERYHGQTLESWTEQVNAKDPAASNVAVAMLNTEIIPHLTNQMFHDTNDSNLRTNLIEILNGLPGIYVYFSLAEHRRAEAAEKIGEFGPAAKAAVPALVQAVQSSDVGVQEQAIKSLGKIHSDPDTLIPLLIKYLDNDDLNDEAATALAQFGSLARPAVPKIIPLLHAADKDARAAAANALRKIDPVALTNAQNAATSR